jgi:hypothetical protein
VAPVPLWAKVLASLVGAATVPWAVLVVLSGTILMTWTDAAIDRTTTLPVGSAPRVQVDAHFGRVIVEAGEDGRVVVRNQQWADGVSRAAAAWSARQTEVTVTRQGDVIAVHQGFGGQSPFRFSRDSVTTIRVPVHTDLDVHTDDLSAQGVDGTLTYMGEGPVQLRNMNLRGTSSLVVAYGFVDLHNVTVSGATKVTESYGTVAFDGSLAPGGSSLDVKSNNFVSIALPRPTDARASITGSLRADPTWGFVTRQAGSLEVWTADLGPDPRGTVTVESRGGLVEFDVR